MARRFISFEGGEGAGKSTQARRLVERLIELGVGEVIATREPGGSPGAEAVRDLLVGGEVERWSALSESLLVYAARADHLERVIQPALRRGAWIVCDRFLDSTRAYQGAGGGADPELIETLERVVVGEHRPGLTLVFDLPVTDGLARARARPGGGARFEAMDLRFHERLRAAFRAIAQAEPQRCILIDASMSLDAVTLAVWRAVRAYAPELAE